MIVSLELAPGSIVSESQLTKQLGFGRTPIREALLVLAQEHLIKPVPGVGSTVAGLNVSDFGLLNECQQTLEPFAARLVAERITDVEVSELQSILDEARLAAEKGDLTLLVMKDVDFHAVMCEATRNPHLTDSMMRVHRLAVRFARYAYDRGAPALTSVEEHQRILDALASHAPDEAEGLMQEHTRDSWERIRAAL